MLVSQISSKDNTIFDQLNTKEFEGYPFSLIVLNWMNVIGAEWVIFRLDYLFGYSLRFFVFVFAPLRISHPLCHVIDYSSMKRFFLIKKN